MKIYNYKCFLFVSWLKKKTRNSLHRIVDFEKKLYSLHLVTFQPGSYVAVVDMLALASDERGGTE